MKNPTKEEVRLAKVLFPFVAGHAFGRHECALCQEQLQKASRKMIRWVERNGWTRKP